VDEYETVYYVVYIIYSVISTAFISVILEAVIRLKVVRIAQGHRHPRRPTQSQTAPTA